MVETLTRGCCLMLCQQEGHSRREDLPSCHARERDSLRGRIFFPVFFVRETVSYGGFPFLLCPQEGRETVPSCYVGHIMKINCPLLVEINVNCATSARPIPHNLL